MTHAACGPDASEFTKIGARQRAAELYAMLIAFTQHYRG